MPNFREPGFAQGGLGPFGERRPGHRWRGRITRWVVSVESPMAVLRLRDAVALGIRPWDEFISGPPPVLQRGSRQVERGWVSPESGVVLSDVHPDGVQAFF